MKSRGAPALVAGQRADGARAAAGGLRASHSLVILTMTLVHAVVDELLIQS